MAHLKMHHLIALFFCLNPRGHASDPPPLTQVFRALDHCTSRIQSYLLMKTYQSLQKKVQVLKKNVRNITAPSPL